METKTTQENLIEVRIGDLFGIGSLFENVHIFDPAKGEIITTFTRSPEIIGEYHKGNTNAVSKQILYSFKIREPKRIRKFDLTRDVNFTYKRTKEFCIEADHDLYISTSDLKIENKKEVLNNDISGEKSYIYQFNFSFTYGAKIVNFLYDREICDTYELKNNEKFGDGSAWGKENAIVYYFDTSKSAFITGREPRHGIIRNWKEYQDVNNLILQASHCHKWEKTEERKRQEETAETIEKLIGRSFSHYDLEKLEKVFTITKKAGAQNV